MNELVAFLRARLDEEEMLAKERLCINCGVLTAPLRSHLGVTGYTHDGPAWEGKRCRGSITGAEPVQNPARALSEVEAKLAIIKAHPITRDVIPESPDGRHGFGCATCHQDEGLIIDRGWCTTLRALGSVYASHPDYREEWRL